MKNDEPGGGAPASAERINCVLVVDDEPVTRLLLGRLFGKAGLDHVVVDGVAAAMAELGRRRFDLLLTDKNLGVGESGVDLAAAARRIDPDIAVILMTGFATPESADELFRLGVDDYVTKPFELPDLLERLKKARELRRLTAKAPAVERRHVLVCEVEPAFRERVRVALASLGCEVRAPASLLEGLRASPAPDAVVAAARLLDPQVRREVFLMRVRNPSLRIAVVGEPSSLEDTLGAIGVSAHQRVSRQLDPPALLAVLAALLK